MPEEKHHALLRASSCKISAGGPCVGKHASCKMRVCPSGSPLLQPFKLGDFQLSTRMIYAPLTRCRAIGHVPTKNAALYYQQRTIPGGFVLTEATAVNSQGYGYPNTPGVYSEEQMAAWRPIVDAVHKAGGTFFMQLWHVGRASHSDYQPDSGPPRGPSAIAVPPPDHVMRPNGELADYPVPEPFSETEIAAIVRDFADAAAKAIEVGFDGVEIHGANGYLVDQFLRQRSNIRTDKYGGSIENRCRFALEVAEAVSSRIGAARTGIRISPFGTYLMGGLDDDVRELFGHLVPELAKLKLLYLHAVEPRTSGSQDVEPPAWQTLAPFRQLWPGPFIAAGGFTQSLGEATIEDKAADLITFGRFWLSTPDLPARFAKGKPLNHYDRATFYSPDPVHGYIDCPTLAEIAPDHPTFTHYSGVVMYK